MDKSLEQSDPGRGVIALLRKDKRVAWQECESTCRQKWTDLKFASKEDCICSGLVVVDVFGLEEWLLAIALIYLHEVDDDRSS